MAFYRFRGSHKSLRNKYAMLQSFRIPQLLQKEAVWTGDGRKPWSLSCFVLDGTALRGCQNKIPELFQMERNICKWMLWKDQSLKQNKSKSHVTHLNDWVATMIRFGRTWTEQVEVGSKRGWAWLGKVGTILSENLSLILKWSLLSHLPTEETRVGKKWPLGCQHVLCPLCCNPFLRTNTVALKDLWLIFIFIFRFACLFYLTCWQMCALMYTCAPYVSSAHWGQRKTSLLGWSYIWL